MYEIDFWNVGSATKSSDAISVRLTDPTTAKNVVIVVDGGFAAHASELAGEISAAYGTTEVDLAISTHPDADHINGLETIVKDLNVKELLLHLPSSRGYNGDETGSNAANELAKIAKEEGTAVIEPTQGLQRFGGTLTIVGPSEDFYRQMLEAQVSGTNGVASALQKALRELRLAEKAIVSKLRQILTGDPGETLTNSEGDTFPRNNTSVITLLQVDGKSLLLTGDAGVPAIDGALDFIDVNPHALIRSPLRFVQIPHHGSRHNVSVDLLDRLLGPPNSQTEGTTSAFVSATAQDEHHPHPKVLNAFKRRGCMQNTNEDQSIRHQHNAPNRENYSKLDPLPWYSESD